LVDEEILYYGARKMAQKVSEFSLGPLVFFFREGEILYLSYRGVELVRRIYFAVRGPNWETAPNCITSVTTAQDAREGSLQIDFSAQSAEGDIDVAWRGQVLAGSRGMLSFRVLGEARRDFLKNRIGICVLLPPTLAGKRVRCRKHEQFGGYLEEGELPQEISPHQPFMDFSSFSVELSPDTWLEMTFEGDIFEMEDQRNWGDASFKIYSTPLRYPFPVLMRQGDTVSQEVRITLRTPKRQPTWGIEDLHRTEHTCKISFSPTPVARIPSIGLGMNDLPETVDDELWETVAALRPSHLRIELDAAENRSSAGMEKIEKAAKAWRETATPLWVLLNVSLPSELPELFDRIPEEGVSRILLALNEPPWCASYELIEKARQEMERRGRSCLLGGGTRGWFAEFHRNPPPFTALDFVFFAFCPQVHAADNETMVENLATLEVLSSQARKISNLPVAISPITFRMRFNPNAYRREERTPKLPPDPRQWGLFGALWTAGALKYAALSDALTFYELLGPHGMIIPEDIRRTLAQETGVEYHFLPLAQVLKEFTPKEGATVLDTKSTNPLAVDALAIQDQEGLLLYVWNYSPQSQNIPVEGVPGEPCAGSILGVETLPRVVWSLHETFDAWSGFSWRNSTLELLVPPLSLVRLWWRNSFPG